MMEKDTVFKFINSFMTILIITFVFLIVFIILSSKISGQEPGFLGYQVKSVLSGSMEPEIKTGAIIFIKQTDNKLLNEGDVISFITKEGISVTHRIVDTDGSQYITKGDNNNGVDVDPVLPQNIVGKYTGFTVPYIGYVVSFVGTNLGRALLLIFPGLYLMGYSVIIINQSFRQLDNTDSISTTSNDEN